MPKLPIKAKSTTTITIVGGIQSIPKDGTLKNPITDEVIVKVDKGFLNVRRPGNRLPRPNKIPATNGNLSQVFADWYFSHGYASAAVTVEEATERFGVAPPMPKHPAADMPMALTSMKDDAGNKWVHLFLGKSIVRVGLVTDKSVLWAWSEAVFKARPGMTPTSSKTNDLAAVWASLLSSFDGSFTNEAISGEKARAILAKTSPPKAAPLKPAPPTPPKALPPRRTAG
jgi:hypothetical protein